jgi:hypothetical protein
LKNVYDEEFQRAAWFGIGPVADDPTECICGLFDDFAFRDFVDDKVVNLNYDQKRAALELLKSFDEFSKTEVLNKSGYLDANATFNDPNWAKVRNSAKKLYDLIS